MKIYSFLILFLLFGSGCSLWKTENSHNINDNNKNRDNINRSVDDLIFNLSPNERKELNGIFDSMRFALNISADKYKQRVDFIKNQYSTENRILEPVLLIDLNVNRELNLKNKIEAKHILLNAIKKTEQTGEANAIFTK